MAFDTKYGTLRITPHVSLEIEISCGHNNLTPAEVADLGRTLQAIARAAQKWRKRPSAVMAEAPRKELIS